MAERGRRLLEVIMNIDLNIGNDWEGRTVEHLSRQSTNDRFAGNFTRKDGYYGRGNAGIGKSPCSTSSVAEANAREEKKIPVVIYSICFQGAGRTCLIRGSPTPLRLLVAIALIQKLLRTTTDLHC